MAELIPKFNKAQASNFLVNLTIGKIKKYLFSSEAKVTFDSTMSSWLGDEYLDIIVSAFLADPKNATLRKIMESSKYFDGISYRGLIKKLK